MTTPNLAKIEQVDLREAWPNEARDFTPWLAENIAQLGEALGMEIEVQQTEAPVGGYLLDILAINTVSNRPVIIENQLEITDHNHLGQLLTYAASFDAEAIVWVSRNFREEHRQALDWLNSRTDEDTRFFAVVVELLRIGHSSLAPNFDVVAAPNEWGKKAAVSRRPLTLAHRWAIRFGQNISRNGNLEQLVQECASVSVEHRTGVTMTSGRIADCFLFSDDSRLAFSDDGHNGLPARAWTYQRRVTVAQHPNSNQTADPEHDELDAVC